MPDQAPHELILSIMEREGVSRAELARRLGVTRGQVTHLLKPGRNLTLRTLADILFVLGHRAKLRLYRPGYVRYRGVEYKAVPR